MYTMSALLYIHQGIHPSIHQVYILCTLSVHRVYIRFIIIVYTRLYITVYTRMYIQVHQNVHQGEQLQCTLCLHSCIYTRVYVPVYTRCIQSIHSVYNYSVHQVVHNGVHQDVHPGVHSIVRLLCITVCYIDLKHSDLKYSVLLVFSIWDIQIKIQDSGLKLWYRVNVYGCNNDELDSQIWVEDNEALNSRRTRVRIKVTIVAFWMSFINYMRYIVFLVFFT